MLSLKANPQIAEEVIPPSRYWRNRVENATGYCAFTTISGVGRLLSFFALGFFLSTSLARAGVSETKRNVLILYDEPRELPGLHLIDQGIETELTKSKLGSSIELYRESLDLTRIPGEHDYHAIRHYFHEKYAAKKFDVVITVMAPSVDFMLNYGDESFPGVPVVFCGLDPREMTSRKLGPNFTGVLITRDFKGTAELVLKLRPHTHQFFFVAGTSGFDRQMTELARADLHQVEDRASITYLTDLSLAETLERVSRLPRDAVVLYATMFRDGAGETFDPYEVVSLLSQRADVPVFGFLDGYVGRGIVGGDVYSVEAQGEEAADLALRILGGEKVSNIPVVAGRPEAPIFDWRQLHRWHIALGSIQPQSQVRYRQPTFWEQYKWRIVAISFVVLAQTALIVFLVMSQRKRRRAESGLRESEVRFRIMADTAPVLIWMSTPDKLCTFFNKAWLNFTGRTMEQELGNGWTKGVHPDDLQECVKTYATAFEARKPFVMQYRLRRCDGQYRWIKDDGVPRYDAQKNFVGYIGSCVDINEWIANEQALRESEERMNLAAEAAQLGMWELNLSTNELWGSKGRRTLLGFSGAEKVTLDEVMSRTHADDRDRLQHALDEAIKTGTDYDCEYRVVLPDGGVRWMQQRGRCVMGADGKPVALRGVSMEVTERKQAEEQFRLAAEASPSGIILVDDRGHISLVNAHIEELFGYHRDELIGRSVDTLLPERFVAGHPAHRAKFMVAPKARAMGAGRELFARRKDGSEFPVEIGLNPIQTPQGILVLASVVDISARKATEAEAQRSRDQIDVLTRVSVLGEMTASISHELNQPLSAIVSNANAGIRFIDKGDVDHATLREILVDVAADGHRAHDIIHNVRNTIKKGGAIRQHINLNDTVSKVVHMSQPEAASHTCELRTSLAENLPTVEGDPTQIQQVLINFVSNAFDAMSETPRESRKVEIQTEQNGDGICVSVRDHGAGIQEEARERLFEQFFTTKEEGLGLGLAIVRSIIEAHGGKIGAENVDGGGARFYFILPTNQNSPR